MKIATPEYAKLADGVDDAVTGPTSVVGVVVCGIVVSLGAVWCNECSVVRRYGHFFRRGLGGACHKG